MKIQVEIAVNGQVYLTKPEELPNNITIEVAARLLYNNIAQVNSYQSPLENGEVLVLGGEAVKRAAFRFIPMDVTF